MCSIFTINQAFWAVYQADVEATLRKQASSNPHGISALFLSANNDNTFIQTESIESIIALLGTLCWDRVFVHCRFSTGDCLGLQNTHGFRSIDNYSQDDGYYVMHNGILNHDNAQAYRVDSIYIAELLRVAGIEATLTYLHTEPYANVFIVHPDGRWYVSRSSGGTLYKDDNFNYSSTPCAGINLTVDNYTCESYELELKPKFVPAAANDYDPRWLDSYPDPVSIVDDISDVNMLEYPDFLDWIYDNGFEVGYMPNKTYKQLDNLHIGWYKHIKAEERLVC